MNLAIFSSELTRLWDAQSFDAVFDRSVEAQAESIGDVF